MHGTPEANTSAIVDAIVKNVHKIFPIESGTKKLEVKNVVEGFEKDNKD